MDTTRRGQSFLEHLRKEGSRIDIRAETATENAVKYTESRHVTPGIIAVGVVGVIVLFIITVIVLIYVFRHIKKIAERERKAKSVSELNIPQALLEPIAFTIPTAPQLPHEMPRGYIPPIRSSERKDVGNSRAPKLGVIGRSKSDKTHVSRNAKERWALLKRSYSDPCKPKKKIQSHIGTIDPDLYVAVERLQEFRPSKYGLGKLSFSLDYEKEISLLTVNLIQATQLPGSASQRAIDTFVKMSLLPDTDNKQAATSKIFRKSVNPRYNQTFVFRLEEASLPETVLRFVVFHYDRYSHPQVVGKVEYELANHDFDVIGSNYTVWKDLVEHPWEDEVRRNYGKGKGAIASLGFFWG